MRKIIIPLLSMISLTASAGNQHEPGDSTKQKYNLWAARQVMKAFATGDTRIIDSVVAIDFIDHTEQGEIGRDSLKGMIIAMHKQLPDTKTTILREFADDEYVFMQTVSKGTSNGEMGMPKGPYEMESIEVIRFKDSKIVEHWSYIKMSDVMKLIKGM